MLIAINSIIMCVQVPSECMCPLVDNTYMYHHGKVPPLVIVVTGSVPLLDICLHNDMTQFKFVTTNIGALGPLRYNTTITHY